MLFKLYSENPTLQQHQQNHQLCTQNYLADIWLFYRKDDAGDGNEFDNDGDDYSKGGNHGIKHFWCGKVSSKTALPDAEYLVNDRNIVVMSSTSQDSLNTAR